MINYIKRKDLEVDKYDACIEHAVQSRIYAFSWYLDIVADNWDVLVLDDYKAVMPIPWRQKYLIKYVYPPFWTLQLGVFSLDEDIKIDSFIQPLFTNFSYLELRMNTRNVFEDVSINSQKKQMQILPLKENYEEIFSNYRRDRKKDLKKAEHYSLIEKWNDNPRELIKLIKDNVGKRIKDYKVKDYNCLLKLIDICIQKNVGEVLSIYDKKNQLVASVFLLKHKRSVTKMVSSTNFKNRKNGANTFMIDRIIYRYHKKFKIFDFGGSSIKNIASFSKSFNAIDEEYDLLKQNNLPTILKFFKS
tara:strand:+ start:6166 stop:7074 length:909 start_codon:yes stop_codon:yes gene_type:complete